MHRRPDGEWAVFSNIDVYLQSHSLISLISAIRIRWLRGGWCNKRHGGGSANVLILK